MSAGILTRMAKEAAASTNRGNSRLLSTGAPEPPPVWQMLCEFANGYCVCAATREDGPPCGAVEVIEQRIRNRVALGDRRKAERRSRP